MTLNKRLSQLEKATENSPRPPGCLSKVYEWLNTPEGKADLDRELYNDEDENESE